jgi:hypothetical protein
MTWRLTPESTARKGRDMYYGIFANVWPRNKKIELRGLDKSATYEVYDYANRRIFGDVRRRAVLQIGFKDSLLIRVRPRLKWQIKFLRGQI